MISAKLGPAPPLSLKQRRQFDPFWLHFGSTVCVCVWSRCGSSSENFPWHWKFRATSLCVSGRPLCPTPTEFISHCFLCTGIYDVTANISFVLRWRISQGSCPYGVKQTANMDRPWLGSWGWVDIMVAVGELLLQNKKKRGPSRDFVEAEITKVTHFVTALVLQIVMRL